MRWKIWLTVVTFVALGVIVLFAWQDIAMAFERMAQLNLWVLALTIPVHFLLYGALAAFFYRFFRLTGNPVSIKVLFPAMMELNFVNHIFPSGGVSGFSYLTLRLKSQDISTAKSTLAQLARFAFTFMIYISLMLLALLLLAVESRVSGFVVLIVSAIVFTLIFVTTVLLFVISNERRIDTFTRVLARAVNKCLHVVKRNRPEILSLSHVRETFLELHADYKLVRANPRQVGHFVFWIGVTCLAEISLLYITFVAHGMWPNPGAVIVAFVLATIAGLFSILPGGIGVYEPLMTAVLISVGVPAGAALSVTLVYRVVTLVLSLLTGYALYQRAIHRHGTASLQRQRIH